MYLKPAKSTGLENIPTRILKDGAVFLKMPITFIINMSIAEGIVPDEFKAAKVNPLFKKAVDMRLETTDLSVFYFMYSK